MFWHGAVGFFLGGGRLLGASRGGRAITDGREIPHTPANRLDPWC